jgi:hypothetical protein
MFAKFHREYAVTLLCRRNVLPLFTFILLAWAFAEPSRADIAARDPAVTAKAIDQFIAKHLRTNKIVASDPSDDSEFLRRAYLDITGTIPNANQAREFLDSKDPARRAKLIDELLASPNYGRHFGLQWCNLVTPRDANMIRPPDTKPLAKWFTDRFNQNQPWNKLVADLLTAEGPTTENPAGIFFILNGDSRSVPQANIATRNLGQLFMGQQVQCAECHNHPFQKWKQDEFWGMAAFFGRVSNTAKNAKGQAGIYETAKGPVAKKGTINVPAGAPAIAISNEAFKNVGKVVPASLPTEHQPTIDPAEPLRPIFAEWLAAPKNPYLAKAAVNRLWANFFGRGFVNPLTDLSEDNRPSHPELLDHLTDEFVDSGFDQKHLIRCICLSQTYQRTSQPTKSNKDEDQAFARMNVKVVGADGLWDSLCVALEVANLDLPAPKNATKSKASGTAPPKLSGRETFYAFFNTGDETGLATEFTHGIPQALRMMNQSVFNEGGKSLIRIAKLPNPESAVEEIYLTALSRRPTRLEAQEAGDFIRMAASPLEGYRGVFWALLNGSEFMLNH